MAPTRAVVCGAGGFIGGHLVRELKRRGAWVRGVDLYPPPFAPTAADPQRIGAGVGDPRG